MECFLEKASSSLKFTTVALAWRFKYRRPFYFVVTRYNAIIF